MKELSFFLRCLALLACSVAAHAQTAVPFAGGGFGDGLPAVEQSMYYPLSLAKDGHGNIYFSGTGGIRKLTPDGIIHTVARNSAAFSLTVSRDGVVYFSQSGSEIGRIDSSGLEYIAGTSPNFVENFGDGGDAKLGNFSNIAGLALDDDGNLFVADSGHHRVRKIDTSGILTTVAGATPIVGNQVPFEGSYSGDGGPAVEAMLNRPGGVAVGPSGTLYISDTGNNRVREILRDGTIRTVAGSAVAGWFGDGGPATSAGLYRPTALTADDVGNLYIVDELDYRIRKVSAAGIISTFAGCGPIISNCAFVETGTVSSAVAPGPGIIVLGADDVAIVDRNSNRVRRVFAGRFSTLAGNAQPNGNGGVMQGQMSGDGGAATNAQLDTPVSLALDSSGALYIADSGNGRVRKVSLDGTISTFAGSGGAWAFAGDGGQAKLAPVFPLGIAFDAAGNGYITDNNSHRIRKVTPAGIISTFAGNGSATSLAGDGGLATAAGLGNISSIAVDALGNVYFFGSSITLGLQRLRKIDTRGIITTIAGGVSGFAGDGGPAKNALFLNPAGMVFDAVGNLYIADSGNGRIRKIDQAGIISTVAGGGTVDCGGGICPVKGPPTSFKLTLPGSAGFDALGAMYIQTIWGMYKVGVDGTMDRFGPKAEMDYAVVSPNGTIYYSSRYRTVVTAITQPWPSTPPSPPTDVTASTSGWVTFAEPIRNGGNTITSFAVTSYPAGGVDLDAGTLGELAFEKRVHRMTGLRLGVPYVFTVHATNAVGDSAESEPSNELVIPGAVINVRPNGCREDFAICYMQVDLDSALAVDLSFDVTATPGTARSGVDYVAPDQRFTIPAGQRLILIPVSIIADDEVELDETFSLRLTNFAGVEGVVVRPAQVTCVIRNTNRPTLSIGDASVQEGNDGRTTASFEVTLSRPISQQTRFFAKTSDGSAAAGTDYIARSTEILAIDPGRTRVRYEVVVNGDADVEANEIFTVTLTQLDDADIGDGTAIGTIVNDDGLLNAQAATSDSAASDTSGPPAVQTTIARIQGTGPVSPLSGKAVETEGVVTALADSGFYLQTPDDKRDSDSASSEGLFVASTAQDVERADVVRARGVVRETQIGGDSNQLTVTQLVADQVFRVGRSPTLPAPVELNQGNAGPHLSAHGLERYEGMRVIVPRLNVVGPSAGTKDSRTGNVIGDGKFYGVVQGVPRPFREPGIGVLDRRRGGVAARVRVFDGNPERLLVDSRGQKGTPRSSADVGDVVTGLVGVLGYGNGVYEILPDSNPPLTSVSGATPRPVSKSSPDQITIGSLDVRLFGDRALGARTFGSSEGYATRVAKQANIICAYVGSPDVLLVAGAANSEALVELTAAANDNDGNLLFPGSCAGNPGYVATWMSGQSSTAFGGLGILAKSTSVGQGAPRVELLSTFSSLASGSFRNLDGTVETLHDRRSGVLRLRVNNAGDGPVEFTLFAAQLSPLQGELAERGPHGWATREDYLRAKRNAQAMSLAKLIEARQRANPKEKLVVLGNFESNEFDDGQADLMAVLSGRTAVGGPTVAFIRSPLTRPLKNLTDSLPAAERYDASRGGNAEMLGHVLVNAPMMSAFPALHLELARVNADFGEDNADDASLPMRAGEYDPKVLYLEKR